MKVSIVTYADLGDVENLKTPTILPLIEKFYKQRELNQVICRQKKNFYFPDTFGALNIFFKLILRVIKLIKPKFQLRVWEQKIFDYFAIKKLKKADIIFVHPVVFPKVIKKAKKQGSILVGIATTIHPKQSGELKRREPFFIAGENFEEKVFNNKEEFLTDSCDYIITLSDFAKETYVQEGHSSNKVFVATTDINIAKYKPAPEKKKNNFQVLFVANLLLTKGLHYLLKAWEDLNLKNAELVVVGKFPEALKNKYYTGIDKMKSVKLVGQVKNIIDYYQESSVLVLPTLSEGFPKVVIEAMACGLSVITTKAGGQLIENGQNGFVVPFRNSEAIKEKINFLYNNPKEAERIGKKAREAVLNKQSFAEQAYNSYKQIIKNEFSN